MGQKIEISSSDIAEQLHSAAVRLLRTLRKEDETGGMNAARLSALSVIVFSGSINLRDLAAAEQVRPPTMTRMVSALEKQGLIERRSNSEDGRSMHISATMAGKRLLIKGRSQRIRPLARQVDSLSVPDQKTLREAARILAAMARAI